MSDANNFNNSCIKSDLLNTSNKERDNVLISLIKKYEKKVLDSDKKINELQEKCNQSEDIKRGYALAIKYWKAVMCINPILFPTIGYLVGITSGYILENVIRGISFLIISSIAIGITCLSGNLFKKIESRKIDNLRIDIEKEQLNKSLYEKDLEKLKKHITPVLTNYDLSRKYDINHEIVNSNSYTEDSVNEEEEIQTNDSIISGPTLIKRNSYKNRY